MRPHASQRARKLADLSLGSLVRGSFSVFLFVSLTACQTTPKGEPTVVGQEGQAEGQWRGKAMVRNLKTGKSGMISLDVIAREPSQLRMEMTGSFGVHVASVAMNGPEVRYVLTQQKRFVAAPADADSLNRLVPVRISPRTLLAVLFERRLPEAEWKCERDPQTKLPSACTHVEEGVVVRWLERNGRNRRLKIGAPEAEVEMVIDEAKSKVEMNTDTFTLAPPNGYKQERVTSS